jgi:hypothetical protein
MKTPGSGRPKGGMNKRTADLVELAEKLGCNPVEVLLRFAMNDWKGLGYESETRFLQDGLKGEKEIMHIPPETRMKAAAEAAQYLYPKRKAVEHSAADGQPLFNTLTDLVKSVSSMSKIDDKKH